jgi:hypothetical protein
VSVFVAGYTFEPRTWNVAFSVDNGETWTEVSPEVDNEYATMALRLVDPRSPGAVFVHAETVAGQGHELWRFDAESGAAAKLLTLEDGELFGGMALSDDVLWVAGRHRGGGSLYRADRGELEFQRVVDSGPAFECLEAHDGILYACVNDFTYASAFILGSSQDEGETWAPLMTVEDLGQVASCGEECSATVDWLTASYGVPPADAGGGGSSGADSGSLPEGTTADSEGGGCQVVTRRASGQTLLAWVGALLVLSALGRRTAARARRAAQKKRPYSLSEPPRNHYPWMDSPKHGASQPSWPACFHRTT